MYSQETRIYLAVLTGVLILVILMLFFIITIVQYQRKKIALHRERLNAEIISLEKERERIASDLHDDLGATLSAIKLRLLYLERDNPKEVLLIEESASYIDEAMRKLKQISFSMTPSILKRKGLPEALYELVEMFRQVTEIKILYECDADPIDKEKRIHIYRIVQEMLNNVLKHAQATSVSLNIKKTDGKILLQVQDNGKGFDKNTVLKKSNGLGLQNIMARVDILKARIYLKTAPGEGVDYFIEIPEK